MISATGPAAPEPHATGPAPDPHAPDPHAPDPHAPDPHAFDAAPYAGGDPYADYRAGDLGLPFTELVELTDRRLGAGVLAAGDEFFAARENLLLRERPVFQPHTFGPKGQVMDGWETRRRRGSAADPFPAPDDGDWALVRLGAPGVIHGVLVDTAHFRGNYPQQVAVEAAAVEGDPGPEELLGPDVAWTELVPRSQVRGHAANGFPVADGRRWTHLRLSQYPDGGIARFRAYGEVVPDPRWLEALGTVDLASVLNGAVVEDASDRFYSPPGNLLLPDRARAMGEGWETRRRRVRGTHDWVRIRLAAEGTVRAVEIDTTHFKGNAAGWVELLGAVGDDDWEPLVPRIRLQPDTPHRFLVQADRPVSRVRLGIWPDGGLARLRVHGTPTGAGWEALRRRFSGTAPGRA
jgi:allantoicase